MNKINHSGQIAVTAWMPEEFGKEIQEIIDLLGVSKHKVTMEAILLGIPLAKYKIALERVMEDKLKFRAL